MLLISLPAFVIYIAAISVSTSYGGVSTGIVAAALALFASTFLFIPPYFSLANERSVLPLLVFYCSAVALNVIVTLAFLRLQGKSKQGTHSKRR
jgi:K+-sensing histidine kinase KdpD